MLLLSGEVKFSVILTLLGPSAQSMAFGLWSNVIKLKAPPVEKGVERGGGGRFIARLSFRFFFKLEVYSRQATIDPIDSTSFLFATVYKNHRRRGKMIKIPCVWQSAYEVVAMGFNTLHTGQNFGTWVTSAKH